MGKLEINLNNFSGGANNFLSPDRLGENSARLLRDLSIDDGSLVSVRNDLEVHAGSPLELGHYGEHNRSVASQFGRHYWSYNDATGAPYYGGSDMSLGISHPEHPPILTTATAAEAKLKGSYRYCCAYVVNGYESAPGPAGGDPYNTIEIEEGQAAVIQVPPPPEGVQQIKIYRTVAEGMDFYLIAVLNRAEAVNPYEDRLPDLDLVFNPPLESLYYLPPPDGGKYLTEQGGAFFLAVDDKLYFSEIGNCHAWNPSNWISFDDTITGVSIEFQGLLVFTLNRVYRVTGNDALTIVRQDIPTGQGCRNYRTIATLSNAPLWISNDGLCLWNGQDVKLLSFQRWKIESTPLFAFAANDRYYLVTERNTVVYDLRSGGAFYEISLNGDYGWYDADRDVAYYRRNGLYYLLEGGHRLQTGIYRSGLLGGNLPLSEFRKLRISANGTVEFTLRDHRGQVIDSGTLHCRDTAETYLATGFPVRGADLELRFAGTLREILLSGWSNRN